MEIAQLEEGLIGLLLLLRLSEVIGSSVQLVGEFGLTFLSGVSVAFKDLPHPRQGILLMLYSCLLEVIHSYL